LDDDFAYYMSGGLNQIEGEVKLLEEEDSKLLGKLKTLNMNVGC
jgi:hypothetical protein